MICYRFCENLLVWHPFPWGTDGVELFPELAENPPPHIAEKLKERHGNIVTATGPPEFNIVDVLEQW